MQPFHNVGHLLSQECTVHMYGTASQDTRPFLRNPFLDVAQHLLVYELLGVRRLYTRSGQAALGSEDVLLGLVT